MEDLSTLDIVLQVATVVVGIAVCTGGGLLSLVPSPDEPLKFIPVYLISGTLFLGGLALICWFQAVGLYVGTQISGS